MYCEESPVNSNQESPLIFRSEPVEAILRGAFGVQRKNLKCPYLRIAFSTQMTFTPTLQTELECQNVWNSQYPSCIPWSRRPILATFYIDPNIWIYGLYSCDWETESLVKRHCSVHFSSSPTNSTRIQILQAVAA